MSSSEGREGTAPPTYCAASCEGGTATVEELDKYSFAKEKQGELRVAKAFLEEDGFTRSQGFGGFKNAEDLKFVYGDKTVEAIEAKKRRDRVPGVKGFGAG